MRVTIDNASFLRHLATYVAARPPDGGRVWLRSVIQWATERGASRFATRILVLPGHAGSGKLCKEASCALKCATSLLIATSGWIITDHGEVVWFRYKIERTLESAANRQWRSSGRGRGVFHEQPSKECKQQESENRAPTHAVRGPFRLDHLGVTQPRTHITILRPVRPLVSSNVLQLRSSRG